MSVDVPQMSELLRLTPTAGYGDWTPQEPGEDTNVATDRRGGALHLSAVLPALSSAIGHPVPTRVHADPAALQHALGLPDATSAIVVLVDGLGYWNLNMRLGHAPYLRSLMKEHANQRPISTCAPSTTVAAMATFGTGTCPGLTGMAGYTQLEPESGRIIQLIQFKDPLLPKAESEKAGPVIDPHDLQREPTVFERLAAEHVRVTSSGLAKFKGSPLTEAALRGSDYVANVTPNDRVRAAAKAARTPGLTYLYIRDADKVGHADGWDSEQWVGTFERIDAQLALLRREAPKGTLIVVVADHGMVATDPAERIDIAAEPALAQGVALVGGEPRALMLYAERDESPEDIAARWRERLGERALVRTRHQAIDDGLFGPVEPRIERMLGDVIVQAAGAVTLVDSRIQSDKATRLPSVHGSQTMLEMDIPCLIDVA
ncbi:nucleotide pyrophosphatase [Bifidobacterium sp. UTCIF-37]|uniref:alkaline phosphatase family protein n=1 Tax=unclassified Bifidobacterium TaxID=2608897 RepID=UPI00112DE675|nr:MULTISPECIES: alkaline phosphatase family protein [unclassified Bifidobacterium]TPF86713.1 nucleotide pyrophosphatase [Bifidobacterium sp. UTCIF-37]TPF89856.1 nucleotide pyrophosphatase [Bifidobacterium sp. UTCIF-38]